MTAAECGGSAGFSTQGATTKSPLAAVSLWERGACMLSPGP